METWMIWRQGDKETREIPMPHCLANRVPYGMTMRIEWRVYCANLSLNASKKAGANVPFSKAAG
jgi:hypothetical protein